MKTVLNERGTKKNITPRKSNQRNHKSGQKNTVKIYEFYLTSVNELKGDGVKFPEFENDFQDEFAKGNVYETSILIVLGNNQRSLPFILSVVHSGIWGKESLDYFIRKYLDDKFGNLNHFERIYQKKLV